MTIATQVGYVSPKTDDTTTVHVVGLQSVEIINHPKLQVSVMVGRFQVYDKVRDTNYILEVFGACNITALKDTKYSTPIIVSTAVLK